MIGVKDMGRRVLGAADVIIPFTPETYDEAFRGRLQPKGLPSVNVDSVMGLPAALACTTAISEDCAKVPLQVFEQSGESRSIARNHPLYDLLHDQPNREQTALEFREWMTAIALNRGLAVAEIKSGPRGPVDSIEPLHPDRTSWETLRTGEARVVFQDPVKGTRRIPRDELFVLRGRGRGVVKDMRRSFGIMLGMQDYQADMYGRGLRSPGFLSHPKTLTNRDGLRTALDEYLAGGERAGRPMLLEEGMEWKTIALSMEDAQFLESLQDGYNQVCMAYRVPQHKIQMLLRATNNNIEQQSTDYVTDSLLGWVGRWEQSIRRDLIVNKARFFARHNLDGLLRGDLKTRWEAYQIAILTGWMTRAEAREKEDWDPIPGLDEPLQMLNMGSGTGAAAMGPGGMPQLAAVPMPTSAGVVSYLRLLVRDGAARVVRKETATLAKLADKADGSSEAWERGAREFYRGHGEYVARVLRVSDETAEQYSIERLTLACARGPEMATDDMDYMQAVAALSRAALNETDILQLPAGDQLEAAA